MRLPRAIAAQVAVLTLSCAAQITAAVAQSDGAPLRITHGPVVESVTDTGAIIAWSTNTNAGTLLHYGVDPNHLDRTAGMPWGGLTHRVELNGLRPQTQYFFRAESPHGQGTGENATGPLSSFETK